MKYLFLFGLWTASKMSQHRTSILLTQGANNDRRLSAIIGNFRHLWRSAGVSLGRLYSPRHSKYNVPVTAALHSNLRQQWQHTPSYCWTDCTQHAGQICERTCSYQSGDFVLSWRRWVSGGRGAYVSGVGRLHTHPSPQ